MSGTTTSGNKGSLSGFCNKEVLYHGLLCIASMAVVVTQATILNFYIIAFYRGYTHHTATYFWFLGDLFIVCLFAISFTTAYRYIHLRRKLECNKNKFTELQIQQKLRRSIYKHVMWLSPKYCGTLPFAFLSWFVYSVYLVCKVAVIFTSEIPEFMNNSPNNANFLDDPINSLNSNLLKVTIGLAALVFIIMLQAHHNHEPDSPHSGYIAGVCHNTAVEVFDSVTLLSLLFVQDEEFHFQEIWNFNKVIILLASINMILPTMVLFLLSKSDMGRHLERVIPIKVLYQSISLLVINIPFLGVRIYIWSTFNYELSLFVVKNLCYIFMLLHSLYPGVSYLCRKVFEETKSSAVVLIRSQSTNNYLVQTNSGSNQQKNPRQQQEFLEQIELEQIVEPNPEARNRTISRTSEAQSLKDATSQS